MREENLARLSSTKINYNTPNFLSYKFIFEDLKAAINLYAKGDLLDIGCGNKPYKTFFNNLLTTYTGCDITQSDMNEVDIICPATNIPLQDNTKDTIFSTQVIEHVADHRKLLSEAYRILKPGGYIIVSGPMCWEHHEEPYDFFRFTKYGFEWLMIEAGFSVIEIKSNGGKWAMVGQMLLNSIRSSFIKKTITRRFIFLLYFIFRVKWIINALFSWLDKVDKDYISTLNFVVTCQKPKE